MRNNLCASDFIGFHFVSFSGFKMFTFLYLFVQFGHFVHVRMDHIIRNVVFSRKIGPKCFKMKKILLCRIMYLVFNRLNVQIVQFRKFFGYSSTS